MNTSNTILIKPKRCGLLYFKKGEVFVTLPVIMLFSIPVVIFWGFNLMTFFYPALFLYIGFFIAWILPSISRARFIKNGGSYKVSKEQVEILNNKKTSGMFKFGSKNFKLKNRFGNKADIIWEGGLVDFIGNFGSRDKEFGMFNLSKEDADRVIDIIKN